MGRDTSQARTTVPPWTPKGHGRREMRSINGQGRTEISEIKL
jgi:hypothetical protein